METELDAFARRSGVEAPPWRGHHEVPTTSLRETTLAAGRLAVCGQAGTLFVPRSQAAARLAPGHIFGTACSGRRIRARTGRVAPARTARAAGRAGFAALRLQFADHGESRLPLRASPGATRASSRGCSP